MKTGVFVDNLSNVTRFMDATRAVEARGSREASWLLVEGDPGYGKTGTLMWYAAPRTPVFVRAKADWSPMWALRDLAATLGVQPMHRMHLLFEAVCNDLMARGCPPILVDEIDHAARSVRVLETLRDITDVTECTLIAGGMKGAQAMMKRFPQIHSRIAEIVSFAPAAPPDVQTVCDALSEVEIAADMAELICKRTQGRLRLIKNAIARVEAFGKKGRGAVTCERWANRPLLNEDRGRPHLVEAARG
jgi:hypothetical protein